MAIIIHKEQRAMDSRAERQHKSEHTRRFHVATDSVLTSAVPILIDPRTPRIGDVHPDDPTTR